MNRRLILKLCSITLLALSQCAWPMNKDTEPKDMFHAISQGDVGAFKKFLKAGFNVNSKSKTGTTLLYEASRAGKLDIVRELLTIDGIEIDSEDKYGDTALHQACSWGHLNVVEELLKNGAAINYKNKMGMAPLHEICVTGYLSHQEKYRDKIVSELLKNGANVDCTDNAELTALDYAKKKNKATIVKLIVDECERRKRKQEIVLERWLSPASTDHPLTFSLNDEKSSQNAQALLTCIKEKNPEDKNDLKLVAHSLTLVRDKKVADIKEKEETQQETKKIKPELYIIGRTPMYLSAADEKANCLIS